MIRRATARDVQAILDLWNIVISQTTVTFTTDEKTPEDISALIQGALPVLVAEHEGRFAGFACLSTFRSGPGYAKVAEHTIYLATGARGHGIGPALLSALEAEARAMGLRALIAAISGSNPKAVTFHTREGFAQVGHMPEVGSKWGQTLDLVLMQKNL